MPLEGKSALHHGGKKPSEREFFVPARTDLGVNSLPAMGAHERPLFEKLLWGLVSSTIFVRW
jgi:hypothetical protein